VVLQNIQIFTFDHLKECGRDVANFLLQMKTHMTVLKKTFAS